MRRIEVREEMLERKENITDELIGAAAVTKLLMLYIHKLPVLYRRLPAMNRLHTPEGG